MKLRLPSLICSGMFLFSSTSCTRLANCCPASPDSGAQSSTSIPKDSCGAASPYCAQCGGTSCKSQVAPQISHATPIEGSELKGALPSCNLLADEFAKRVEELQGGGIFSLIREVRELEDGFDFAFQESEAIVQQLLDYINFERKCCSDFSFALEFEPHFNGIHLKVFGSAAVKEQVKNAIEELEIKK